LAIKFEGADARLVPFPAACTKEIDAEWVDAAAIALVVGKTRRILQAPEKINKNNVFRFE
jgi:hypothetical protein